MPKNAPTTKLNGFKTGLNTRKQDGQMFDSELRQADNVDIYSDGEVARRKGFTQINAGGAHSIWATPDGDECYFVRNNSLYELNTDFTESALRSDLALNRPMSFGHVNGSSYYSDGDVHGCIIAGVPHIWGPENPQGIPSAVSALGALGAGTYQYLVTFVTADGVESGAGLAGTIVLDDSQGIALSNIPIGGTGIDKVQIYISQANSTAMFYSGVVVNGVTTATVVSSDFSIPLRTQMLDLMPKGHIVRYFSGRMLVADGNTLWFSDPYGFHLCDLKKNFLLFPERIAMVEPVANGFFVSADKTYFVSGTDMNSLTQVEVAAYRAIEGTSSVIEGSLLNLEAPIIGQAATWLGARGICVGLPSGAMLNLTEERVAMEITATRGAGLVREEDGITQFIGVTPKGEVSGIAASDVAVAEIIRNGIVV